MFKALVASAAVATLASALPAFDPFDPFSGPNEQTIVNQLKVGSTSFVNHGLVGAGSLPSDIVDSLGDTIGGIGSAIAVDQLSWIRNFDGTYSGVLYAQPDRGWNTEMTVNYKGRVQVFDMHFDPYYGTKNQTNANQIELTYQRSIVFQGPDGIQSTGLDALEIYTSREGIEFPAAVLPDGKLGVCLDLEGLVHNPLDNTFWSSDEYGPYIYHFSITGEYLGVIVPPPAFIPTINGKTNFTGNTDPDTGRESNHGFEGLSISADGRYLYALLQAALVQDGGTHATREEYTRLLKYDLLNPFEPKLEGEYVVVLPQFDDPAEAKNPRTGESSELHFINENQFLFLPRDSNRGQGMAEDQSIYRFVEIFDISNATNIAGSKFDNASNPVAPDGESLDPSVTPATSFQFVDYNNEAQLARVGMHNGDPDNSSDLDEKWESLALAPTFLNAQDFFLFSMSDNDFITQNGHLNGQTYVDDSGLNLPTQILAFWVSISDYELGLELVI